MPGLSLLVKLASGACNLRCRYCFYAELTARREASGYLEHWVAENMMKNIEHNDTDPMWSVIHEGGPFHYRGYLANYCEHLENTGRVAEAAELRRRHPNDLLETY